MHTRPISIGALTALALLATVAACKPERRDTAADSAGTGAIMRAAPADSSGMAMGAGDKGMSDMHQDTVAAKVEAHLKRLQTANADSLRALVPDDRRVVTALIADCEQMMRAMKMDPPRKWHDAVAALRTDLDRMAKMTGAQLAQAMPGHRTRIEGMLAMRHDMMRM